MEAMVKMKKKIMVTIKMCRKLLCFMLALVMVGGLFCEISVSAKEISLQIPTIKVKSVNNGTGVKVTVSKAKNAEGFEIFAYGKMISYGDYRKIDDEYQKIAEIDKNGNSKRSIVIKSLPAGSYKIKVRSFKNFGGVEKYSEFSKTKSVKVSEAANGYETSYDFSKIKKGDVIEFGAYEQDCIATNGKEPIEWIVLEKNKKQIFAISKYALDCVPYNKERIDVTWETCTLRKWLNESFYQNAFNSTEKQMIKTTKVENYDNLEWGVSAGNDTKDKVFILSQLDIINSDYGFCEEYGTDDKNRHCDASLFAAWKKSDYSYLSYSVYDCDWWLRTPGMGQDAAITVFFSGYVATSGYCCDSDNYVRPSICINLTS